MNNSQLVQAGLSLMEQISEHDPVAVGDTAVLQRLDPQNSKLTAWLIAERQSSETEERDVLRLFRQIEAGFDESELAGLCFELGVDMENLNGHNRLDKIRSLVTYMQRRSRLPDLVERCARIRIG
jgi:hypothetical protein